MSDMLTRLRAMQETLDHCLALPDCSDALARYELSRPLGVHIIIGRCSHIAEVRYWIASTFQCAERIQITRLEVHR